MIPTPGKTKVAAIIPGSANKVPSPIKNGQGNRVPTARKPSPPPGAKPDAPDNRTYAERLADFEINSASAAKLEATAFKTASKGRRRISTPASVGDALLPEKLPPFQYVGELISEALPEPPVLLQGILHQGEVMMMGGTAKSRKTWSFIDMGICVATGNPWWGFDTTQGLVVYLDFELERWAFSKRVDAVLEAKAEAVDGADYSRVHQQLIHWSLRGSVIDLNPAAIDEIIRRLNPLNPALVIFDPIYRTLGDRNENAAGDIGDLMNLLQRLAKGTGAAVVLGHHFSKGNQAEKEAIDRLSGSGVWGRFADTLFIMTQQEQYDTFGSLSVEVITRSFPPVEKFVVLPSCYALMARNDEFDANKLKRSGATQKYTDEEILAPLQEGRPLTKKEWFAAVADSIGISLPSFNNRTATLEGKGLVAQLGEKRTDPWVLAP